MSANFYKLGGTPKNESALQSKIAKILTLKGIAYIQSRCDRPTTNQKGTPDFIFAVIGQTSRAWNEIAAVAWEIKMPKGKLQPEQEAMRDRMTKSPNCWRYSVIHSVDEAIKELESMGL